MFRQDNFATEAGKTRSPQRRRGTERENFVGCVGGRGDPGGSPTVWTAGSPQRLRLPPAPSQKATRWVAPTGPPSDSLMRNWRDTHRFFGGTPTGFPVALKGKS